MPEVKYGGVVPQDALDFFNAKKLRPSFDYRDVWREEHAINFTVAKGVKLDILADIREGLRKALAEGKTFEQFRKELTPLLQAKGWWGKRDMIDPETGEVKTVQLGSPRRLRTIYDANMRSARAAGQWACIQRSKEALPYLLYELGPSLEHRPEHQRWKGVILPIDHAFWKTHFAPNGWGCKCRIRQISASEAGQLLQSGNYTDQAPPVKYVPWLNKRTGLTEDVPEGIDPGWDTNPGWLREIGIDRDFVSKSLRLDRVDDARELFISPVRTAEFAAFAVAMAATARPGAELRTVAVLGENEIRHLASSGKMVEETLIVVEGRLMAEAGGHKSNKADRHKTAGNALSVQQWQQLPQLLPEAQYILWQAASKQWVYLIKADGDYIKVVVSADWQSKRTVKAGWAEKLNMVRTAFLVTPQAVASLLKQDGYERIK